MDGNLKLILGLIWTLILHYSISMPMWDEEEEADDGKQKTPKQRLLGWIQNKLPELPITNFNRDWQTGRALGALVDSCAPGEAKCLNVFWYISVLLYLIEGFLCLCGRDTFCFLLRSQSKLNTTIQRIW